MRITCITTTLNSDSGIGRMSLEILERLRSRGICCKVIVQQSSAGPEASLLPSNSMLRIVRNALTVRRLSAESDIVHAFDAWPYAIYGLAAVIGTQRKLFINGVGTYSLMGHVRFFKRLLLTVAYGRAQRVLCVSRFMEQRILAYVPKARTEVVYLGSTPLLPVSDAYCAHVRSDRGLNHANPIVLTVGGIKPRKGQLDTLEAVLSLRKKYPSITYVAVGASHDEQYVETMRARAKTQNASDALLILSDVRSREEVSALFTLCDVYALNSTSTDTYVEGFGLSIIEAASIGKLSVASTNNGTEEAVDDGTTGYLAPQRDVRAIAHAIERTLAVPRDEATRRAKKWAARFTWDATVEGYVAAYSGATRLVR